MGFSVVKRRLSLGDKILYRSSRSELPLSFRFVLVKTSQFVSRKNAMSQELPNDRTESQKLTPEEARLVMKAIEEVEREEAAEQESQHDG